MTSQPARRLPKVHRREADITEPGPAADALRELRARRIAHKWVHARRSSQAFALNLFAPLHPAAVAAILTRTNALSTPIIDADPIAFEWEDAEDHLRESSATRPHRTQVDVRLDGRTATGVRATTLIEVKFTETNFGTCSARESPRNPHPDVCDTPGRFGDNPDRCFQLANHGHGRRRYDHYLPTGPAPHRTAETGGCWFAGGTSQPMRNIALAGTLLARGAADHIAYALCAPAAHHSIWRRHAEVLELFSPTDTLHLAALHAEDVADLHIDRSDALRRRYPSPGLT